MSQSTDPKARARDLFEQAAVQAWGQLRPGRPRPARVEVLHGRCDKAWKRTICRLEGAGPAGAAVIAKRCAAAQAAREYTIYVELLPHLPVPTLHCYGCVEDADERFRWLFLEDAGEEKYDPQSETHRVLAARWLGSLHTTAARLALLSSLPYRGPGHYREHLRSACDTILSHLADPALRAGDTTVLRSLVSQCDHLAGRWDRVEDACAGMPETLVHGDFKRKNLRVRTGPGTPELLPFDWELVGWGVPGVDFGTSAQPDLATYWSVVDGFWPGLDFQGLQRLVHVGRIFRCLAAIDWAAQRLPTAYPEKALFDLRLWEPRLVDAIRAAGWEG
jgi:hypothetical protein